MADVRIVSIGTAVPPTRLDQAAVRELLLAQPGRSRLAQRLTAAAIDGSAVATRYTAIAEFAGLSSPDAGAASDDPPLFFDAATHTLVHSSTGVRNAFYTRAATPLALEAARRALAGSGLAAADVTHVITVSCTGFFAPGPDYEMVRGLGLPDATRRLHVGFMGCYGAFPALRTALDACTADPGAVVLVVCVELCTLHLRGAEDPDAIVADAVFGDGAAAAVVTALPVAAADGPGLRIDRMHTVLAPDSAHEMTWTVGDLGFEMRLSSYVPKVIEAEIGAALAPLRPGRDWPAVEHWAVHPGGRAILDRVQTALGLPEARLEPSRAVLRENGNMSSPTVLFVLQRILRDARPGQHVVATAFGPGLTVESALLTVTAEVAAP